MIRCLLPLLLTGCPGAETQQARPAALNGIHTTLDRDTNGRIDAAEYTATVYAAPPFSSVDSDGDGHLDLTELDALLSSQDPLTFDDRRDPPGVDLTQWRKPFSGDPAERLEREIKEFTERY